jgi:hypothetical protein
MDWSYIPFKLFGLFLSGVMAWSFCAQFLRERHCRLSWARTSGRIKKFCYHYGEVELLYEYTVEGRTLESGGILPGASRSLKPASRVRVSKSFWLNPDGALKFKPGSEVEVFYDPQNPADAALATDNSLFAGMPVRLILLTAGLLNLLVSARLLAKWQHFFPLLFICVGLAICGYSLACLRRHLRSRRFSSTGARLLSASVAYENSGEGGGYAPRVEFEYTVDGVGYNSHQLTALSAVALSSRPAKVQAAIDRMKAAPCLTVYYDPRAPWDAFLRHGPVWGAYGPFLMGLAFTALGIFLIGKTH